MTQQEIAQRINQILKDVMPVEAEKFMRAETLRQEHQSGLIDIYWYCIQLEDRLLALKELEK